MGKSLVFLSIAAAIAAVPTFAQAPNCAGISDEKARLACYDRGAKPKAAAPRPGVTSAPELVDSTLLDYRGRLERALLENGVSAEVIVDGTNLTIWMFLNRAMVFQLITKAKILDSAKEAGFNKVRFWDKGNDGAWLFDLTKPGSCARGLCWSN
jgi:hypothetical protein